MSDQPVIWIVGINYPAEQKQKFDTWYDEVHVPMLLKGGFVKKVTRSILAGETYQVGAVTQPCPTSLTIYEFENKAKFDAWMTSPARAEAGADKEATWGDAVYDVQWATRYDQLHVWND